MRQSPSKSILVIDDDEANRFIARKVLEGAGYVVHEAANADAGLEQALARAPHLIILDLVMPGSSGFDFLAARIRKDEISALPIIVVSSLRDRDSVARAVVGGASDYIVKPLEARVLLRKVRKALLDQQYAAYRFPENELPEVQAGLQATVVMANEAAFVAETSARIAPGTSVEMQSSFFADVGIGHATLKKTIRPAVVSVPGQYLNEISTIGLSPESIETVRRVLKEGK